MLRCQDVPRREGVFETIVLFGSGMACISKQQKLQLLMVSQ